MEGVLVIDKPSGPTSHDAVARVRRALGIRRIGHTGTLDPLATGVLPLVVGRATRLAQFFSASDKEYVADIALGATSETYDAEGPLTISPGAPFLSPLEPGALEAVLNEFRGTFEQMPPAHSAKKIGGIPAYKLARRKRPAEMRPIPVTVDALEILAVDDNALRIRIVCSPGFYVRTLAHEIGVRLGRGAYLAGLRRIRVGAFTLEAAVPLEDIQKGGVEAASSRVIKLDELLTDIPAVVLSEAGARRAAHGNVVTPEHLVAGAEPPTGAERAVGPASKIRLLDASGTLLAIAERRGGAALHPTVVLV